MTSLAPPQDALRAGLFMVAASASFVTNDTFVKLLGGTVPVGEIIAVRGSMSSLLLAAVCLRRNLFPATPQIFGRGVLARSAFDLFATFLFIVALIHMPIANLTSIIQAVPLAVIIMAYVFLGEAVGWRRTAAIIVGFIGVLLIARPSPQSFNIYDGLALLIVFAAAIRDIITRRIPTNVPSLIVAFANALLVTAGGFVFGLFEGFIPLELWQFGCLAAASLFLGLGYAFIVLTLRLGEIAVSAPFRYVNVVFSIFSGIAVFGEFPDLTALAGMALIVASGLYTIHRERMLTGIAGTRRP
jgi:drug/metabolite transporter (DMT)-like permease